jgi:hypothetical protein
MRHIKDETASGQGKRFQGKTNNRPSKYGMLATQACTCGYLARHNVNQICATCARCDAYGREVALRRMFGYMGYAL